MPPQFRRAPAQDFVSANQIFEYDSHAYVLLGFDGRRSTTSDNAVRPIEA